jgi:hypothetical protein
MFRFLIYAFLSIFVFLCQHRRQILPLCASSEPHSAKNAHFPASGRRSSEVRSSRTRTRARVRASTGIYKNRPGTGMAGVNHNNRMPATGTGSTGRVNRRRHRPEYVRTNFSSMHTTFVSIASRGALASPHAVC